MNTDITSETKCNFAEMSFDELYDHCENSLIKLATIRIPHSIFLKYKYIEVLWQSSRSKDAEIRSASALDVSFFTGRALTSSDEYDDLLKGLQTRMADGFLYSDIQWKEFIKLRSFEEGLDETMPYQERSKRVRQIRLDHERWQKKQESGRPAKIRYLLSIKDYLFEGIDLNQRSVYYLLPRNSPTHEIVDRLRSVQIQVDGEGHTRLSTIERFLPDYFPYAIGLSDSFIGYVIYKKAKSDIVIAEKPHYGNATYVIRGGLGKALQTLKQSRSYVRKTAVREDVRIVEHNNHLQWIAELKQVISLLT